MKYTIEGFSQEQAIKLGLDVKDLVFLRWIVDFYATGLMDIKQIDGRSFFWVSYDYVMRELPILGINSRGALGNRLRNMSTVMDCKMVATSTGNRTYCGFKTIELNQLISKCEPPHPKAGWVSIQKRGGCPSKSGVLYDSSINDSSINDSNKQPGRKTAAAAKSVKPVENSKTAHTDRFLEKAKTASLRGFNIFQMTNRFYKQSKLREALPEKVLEDVLDEFLNKGRYIFSPVYGPWPYFLTVLKSKSARHFAAKNEEEAKQFKKEPAAIGNILAVMSRG